MTYEELSGMIVGSEADEWLYNDSKGIFTYKPDLSVRIEREEIEDDFRRQFAEEWASKHPDPSASRVYYNIFVGASFVEQHQFVAVDGSRAELPLPRSRTDLVITKFQYQMALVVNRTGRVDEYLERSGIRVEG